ncbi:MAG: peptidoglycan DD-metalloendopeptidase family protein [Bacteroidales bacterium]|nr:peptidoglycan DD-metalloendopeptidase family protein [Bacteroidales bacterium]MCF8338629.1 peptidoglycan DD-metalloendopeptidase family protein [Bacteroidales bacterium]
MSWSQKIAGFIFVIVLISCVSNLHAQTEKKKLKQEKQKLEKEIELTSKLIEETKKSKKTSLNEVVLANKKIQKRQQLITNIESEIQQINNSIVSNQKRISELEKKLEKLKEEYAQMIRAAQQNRNDITRLMYIFSSDDFNQAIRRMRYFKQYSRYRHEQTQLIKSTHDSIEQKNAKLRQMREKKISLKARREMEKKNLVEEKTEHNKAVKRLANKEKELLEELRRKEKAAKELQRAIEKAIANEIKKSEEAERPSGERTIKRTFEMTPEQAELSDNFSSNKGKLPWPTKKGIISSTYGEHSHPVLEYVKTKNNGIDILTSSGIKARAVFEGEVTNIMTLSGQNRVVILRHGEYLTVYSNLKEVSVNIGEKIQTKDAIGEIHTDPETSKTQLHFELWKGKKMQNPSHWLAD